MSHADDHCEELLGAYVLGACTEDEAAAIAEHLAQCVRCTMTAQRLREGADRLLMDVPRRPPSPRVKDRVMGPVRAEAALFDAAREGSYQKPRPRDHERPAGEGRPPERIRRRPAVLAAVLAAALASVLLLAALGGALLSGGLSAGAPQNVVLTQIERILPSGAAVSLEIRGGGSELQVRGMQSAGPGRVYQVWVRNDRQLPEPAGAVLEVGARGTARTRLPGDIRRFDQVLVTSEPAGGSPLPTRLPVLEVATSA